jgi:dipeptidase E
MGLPYVGSSAGANIAGVSVQTTNDMPVVFPPSLHALELVPFNINPHYPDIGDSPPSNGETREERIREYHAYNDNPVLALRGQAMVEVEDLHYRIRGSSNARLFRARLEPEEIAPADTYTPISVMFERSVAP